METMNARVYTQNHMENNGRDAWHYMIDTPIGQFHIIDGEQPGKEIKRMIIENDNEKAERKFQAVCKKILKGETL